MVQNSPLPDEWKWSTLGEACLVNLGQSPSSDTYNTEGIGLPFYQGKAEFGDLYPTTVKWCSVPGKIAEAGDILISVRAPVGPTNLCQEKSCIGRGLAALRLKCGGPSKYLLYYLRMIEKEWDRKATGTTFKAITGDVLRHQEIPLAPLPEQERIVAKIEELFTQLDAGVAALKRIQAGLKRYKASVLKAACEGRLVAQDPSDEPAEEMLRRMGKAPFLREDLPSLPEGWCWTKVGDMATVGTGATPLRSKSKYWENATIPWITSGALNELYVNKADEYINESALRETNVKLFPAGSLLVAMYGEGRTRGKVSELLIGATTNQACAALIFDGLSSECKPYVKLFFQRNYEDIRRLSSGGVQPNLNLSIIKNTHFPLPPLAEQLRIVSEVERRLSLTFQVEAAIETAFVLSARLRQAILKRAFEGKLVQLGIARRELGE